MIKTKITGIGDPFVLVYEGVYYMYATSAKDGFKYYTSTNLTDWEDKGYCLKNSSWGECDFWAPEVFERNGKFYMIYTARWNKNHSLRIGVSVADKPSGPFEELTKGPLFDFGYAAIDATLHSDENGKEYLYFVRDCSENVIDGVHTSVIYVSEISKDYTRLLTQPIKISEPDCNWEVCNSPDWHWNEGPAVLKRGSTYYMCYSANCYASRDYSVGYSISKSPLGPFEKYKNNPVLKYGENDYSGPDHNSFFEGLDGKLYTAFHVHTDYDCPSGDRRACIAEVVFDNEGNLKILV